MAAECFVIHYKGKPLWDQKEGSFINGKWVRNPDTELIPYFAGRYKAYKKESYAKSAITSTFEHTDPEKRAAVLHDIKIVRYLPEGGN